MQNKVFKSIIQSLLLFMIHKRVYDYNYFYK